MSYDLTDAESFYDLELEAENTIDGIKVEFLSKNHHGKSEYQTGFERALKFVSEVVEEDMGKINKIKVSPVGTFTLILPAYPTFPTTYQSVQELMENVPQNFEVHRLVRWDTDDGQKHRTDVQIKDRL